jgi:5-dehydro-2-deoxygluconokinase
LTDKTYDLLTMGRSSIDLYANEIGAPFTDIKSFAAYVGGCPTNVCVGARRLGLRTAIINGVGDDLVGDFVLSFLEREGVDTRFSCRKTGRRTSAFLLAIQPPDNYPIVPYRDNCADLELTIDDVTSESVADTRALLITGTGLSRQPSRDATLFAAELGRERGTKIVLDLDFRPELWPHARAYGVAVRSAARSVDVLIGTTEEIRKAALSLPEVGEPGAFEAGEEAGDRADESAVESLLAAGAGVLVEKRGPLGTLVHLRDGATFEVPTFEVEVLNVLGAGDAFAAGLIYGYLKGWDWRRAVRLGNACGAIVVTRHGCANFMPREEEALAFIEERGGF